MTLFDDVWKVVISLASARIYDVTVIVEQDGVLIGEKKIKRLMTFQQAREMIK